MATINIDSKLLEALQLSTCFGIAHDETTPECKQCDVKGQCKVKTEGGLNIPTPISRPKEPVKMSEGSKTTKPKASSVTTPKPTAKAETLKTKPQTSKPKSAQANSGNAPDFKPMELDALKTLAEERSVEWKDYGNDNITRMRLIMSLKKSY